MPNLIEIPVPFPSTTNATSAVTHTHTHTHTHTQGPRGKSHYLSSSSVPKTPLSANLLSSPHPKCCANEFRGCVKWVVRRVPYRIYWGESMDICKTIMEMEGPFRFEVDCAKIPVIPSLKST